MKRKKTPWLILLIIGLLPFAVALGTAIYAAFAGYNGLSIMSPLTYGWPAFCDWIILWSCIYWPTYIIGLICIMLALLKLRNKYQ